MGIMDLFKAKENEKLKKELQELKDSLTSEQLSAKNILGYIEELEERKSMLEVDISNTLVEVNKMDGELIEKKNNLIILEEELLMQDFGLYKPMYSFASSYEYKEKLESIRKNQKEMIKNKTSVSFSENWTVDGSKAKGKKMTNDNIKQIIRTFNVECENAIDRVKFNNIDSMQKRIEKSFESLNKLNQTVSVAVRAEFLHSKIQELYLAYEYQLKKQEEKEEQKRIREDLKEQARLKKELEDAKKNVDKDLKHYNNALQALLIQMEVEKDSEKLTALLDKKNEIDSKISELNKNLEDIDYRQENQKAGYVYVISNIGAFGENVFKIGMTRRLDPQDRISELGNASVPFNFDVHCMIFSKDAPALENALHKAFEDKKVNMINTRREFFNVELKDIEEVIKLNFDKTVEFNKLAEAEQYRESVKMKEALTN